jgi:hypothetical protein
MLEHVRKIPGVVRVSVIHVTATSVCSPYENAAARRSAREDESVQRRVLQFREQGTLRPAHSGGATLLAACLLAAACASVHSQDDPPAKQSRAKTPQASSMVPQDILDAALDDAVNRTATPREQILVTSAAAVTWSNGSLGCPASGMLYTQALVPGYRIVLAAGALELNYHAGVRGKPVFCPAERVVAPAPSRSDAT